MEYIIKKPFKFAHGGIRVEEFVPGKEPVELTGECAEVALAEGWVKAVRARAANDSTQEPAADAADAPEVASEDQASTPDSADPAAAE
jgi:hypothetical protein